MLHMHAFLEHEIIFIEHLNMFLYKKNKMHVTFTEYIFDIYM